MWSTNTVALSFCVHARVATERCHVIAAVSAGGTTVATTCSQRTRTHEVSCLRPKDASATWRLNPTMHDSANAP
eukprot:scaffold47493_cov33-Prasinocladus_malaysianus.AAC.1